ncbi:peptidyl-prolyl cis-trans isomerase [Marinibactrum halimedae]|uniref:peptidylprolyl isomerase n=2 Tax=Marinibactrum halimedae TaxID=1444977 RepID=A0AA37T4L9_9GAMM|nr:peptidyl-prolyl cis-trans isomerase [Marinibactrum halimedae]MCD9457680.1 peptidyl-prolyl cis-trans isomerase [Marinibactrum halimedae]GLS24947.1 hypothetical protein GCM10007877_06610 [Marinibactrum halimedae]
MKTLNYRSSAVALSLAASLLLAGCEREPQVATVENHSISAQALMAEAERLNVPKHSADLHRLLEQLIDRHAAVAQLKALKLDEDPSFQRAYRKLVMDTLLEHFETALAPSLSVTEDEARAVYEKDIKHYTQPRRVRIALIEFEADSPVAFESHQQLSALPITEREALFSRLAVSHSKHRPSRYRGGDVGFFSEGKPSTTWHTDVINAGLALTESGALSPVIQTSNAQYILRLLETEPETVQPFKDVKNNIMSALKADKLREIKHTAKAQLRNNLSIERDAAVLASLVDPEAKSIAVATEPTLPAAPLN